MPWGWANSTFPNVTNFPQLFTYATNSTNGIFGVALIFLIFIITFLMMKRYNTSVALLASSWFTIILGGFLYWMRIILNWEILTIFFGIGMVSAIMSYLERRGEN